MNWLKKIWDKVGWIVMLPLILLAGTIALLVVGLAGGLVSMIFTKLPVSVWGSFIGLFLWLRCAFYLRRLSRESGLGFGWHLVRSIGGGQICAALFATGLLAVAIASVTAPGLFTNLWRGALAVIGFGIFLIIMFGYVFVCGELLAKGVILLRRRRPAGLLLLPAAAAALAGPAYGLVHYWTAYREDENWVGLILTTGIGLLIVFFLVFWFVVSAFEAGRWTPAKETGE